MHAAKTMSGISMVNAGKKFRHAIARTARRYPFLIDIKRRLGTRNQSPSFSNSQEYWETRYSVGGDSGEGSYGKLARYKANFINDLYQQHACKSAVEFGCGDGNQASLFNIPCYTGIDISKKCIDACNRKLGREGWNFLVLGEYKSTEAPAQYDLALSLDVVYHLVEDDVYKEYLTTLFSASRSLCLIYASNFDQYNPALPHVRHRSFVTDIEKWHPEWAFLGDFKNPYLKPHDSQEYGSFAQFHLFQKNP